MLYSKEKNEKIVFSCLYLKILQRKASVQEVAYCVGVRNTIITLGRLVYNEEGIVKLGKSTTCAGNDAP